MKAIVYTDYGPPDHLQLQAVETPVPRDDEVLIRVHASSINAWDWDLLRGRPYLTRLAAGALRKPKYPILGADVAGTVEAVGREVERFQAGDAVFGDLSGSGWGGFAEYTCARETVLATIPGGVSFEHAAATPQAGVIALQALRKGKIDAARRVLIVGAGGGAGTFAVQLAKEAGATVTGVDRSDKLEMLRAIGADQVIDYRQDDFSRMGQQYDLIVDMVMQRGIGAYRRALAPDGRLVVVGGTTGLIAQVATLGTLLSRLTDQSLGLLVHRTSRDDMETLGNMLAAGTVVPAIDRTYPLADLPEAFHAFGAGDVKGKYVISVLEEQRTTNGSDTP